MRQNIRKLFEKKINWKGLKEIFQHNYNIDNVADGPEHFLEFLFYILGTNFVLFGDSSQV